MKGETIQSEEKKTEVVTCVKQTIEEEKDSSPRGINSRTIPVSGEQVISIADNLETDFSQ